MEKVEADEDHYSLLFGEEEEEEEESWPCWFRRFEILYWMIETAEEEEVKEDLDSSPRSTT